MRRDEPTAGVVVVGGGIAGAWLAYRLSQCEVKTILIAADDPPVSRCAVAVLERRLVESPPEPALLADSSATQDPGLWRLIRHYAPREYEELARIVKFMPCGELMMPRHASSIPRLGAGKAVVDAVMDRFTALGGITLHGRVTDLLVEDGVCHGLRYTRGTRNHRIFCQHLVIASGGLCGLYADGTGTGDGRLLGTYARCGGTLANLELYYRFALGDLTHRRPFYPADLEQARLYRDGKPATWLVQARSRIPPRRFDLQVFREYWVDNTGVPHIAALPDGPVCLGPIRGFTMGGIVDGSLAGVHAAGEARYDLVADCIIGVPWATFLATTGMLAERLSQTPGNQWTSPESGDESIPAVQRDPELPRIVQRGLAAFQDDRFSEPAAENFVSWCRRERRLRRSHREDVDLLILAEACAASALARTESRGFFFRADQPSADPGLTGRHTQARYDAETDRVRVDLIGSGEMVPT